MNLAKLIAFILSPFLLCAAHAQNQIYIDVGQATVKKSLLAFPPLNQFGSEKEDRRAIDLNNEIYKIVQNDLTVSNYFTFIRQDAFLENTAKLGLKPAPGEPNGFQFKNWAPQETDFLIRGGVKLVGEKLTLEIYAYHVKQAKLIFGRTYESSPAGARKLAHSFSNDLVKALTGKRGAFDTKLVAVMRKSLQDHKEVYTMDWDGANLKQVTNLRSITISPAWSPKADRLAFTSFAYHENIRSRNADLFIYELNSGKKWLVSYKKGINSGAFFMPDGENLLMTISQSGTPDIYKVSADGREYSRITNGPNRAMNVEPALSPDGKKIAFSSDRSGQPMIYVMNFDGSGIKRLTFAGRYNSTPTWHPDGKSLVFAGFDKDHFDLFSINIDGTGLKRLTDARKPSGRPSDNRDPSYSPDGRQIAFVSDRTGNKQIYITDPDGEVERRITSDRYEWDQPKWSPFLD